MIAILSFIFSEIINYVFSIPKLVEKLHKRLSVNLSLSIVGVSGAIVTASFTSA
jgi:hypothetical protein